MGFEEVIGILIFPLACIFFTWFIIHNLGWEHYIRDFFDWFTGKLNRDMINSRSFDKIGFDRLLNRFRRD